MDYDTDYEDQWTDAMGGEDNQDNTSDESWDTEEVFFKRIGYIEL